jgi:hypothetical protein
MGKPIQVTFKNNARDKELSEYIHGKDPKAGWIKEAAYKQMLIEKQNLTPVYTQVEEEKTTKPKRNDILGIVNQLKEKKPD